MAIEIYKAREVLAGTISLKTAPRVIVIKGKGNDEEKLFQAVDVAIEVGYRIIAAYDQSQKATRIILERE